MKEIHLTNSTEVVVVVDNEDYDRINRYKWALNTDGYAIYDRGHDAIPRIIWLHNEVLNVAPGSGVDHINQCKWDNTKENLRLVNRSTNRQNSLSGKNTTGFKGVTFNKATGKYVARINKEGQWYYLGYFKTAEEAADAYDKRALELYGKSALTNAKIRSGGY